MSAYLDCATEKGIYQHIRDGESCRICKDWIKKHDLKIKDGKVVNPPKPVQPPKPAAPAAPKARPKRAPRPKPEKPKTGRRVAQCGTTGGSRKHYADKTKPCEPCLEASRKYQRERRAKNGAKTRVSTELERVHGSLRGFQQHYRLKETPCEPCRIARNTYKSERRAIRRATSKKAA